MNFLKRYYDKVILLALFILFVGLMLSVLSKVEETSVIKADDLKLPPRKPDHECVDDKSDDFKADVLWKKAAMVWNSGAKGSETASDLIKAEKLAVCPYCSEKAGDTKVLVPFSAFGGKCPNADCGKDLPTPENNPEDTLLVTANDTDGDRISNEDEKKYGLNPDDPNDATGDLDGDGFSNRYEISQKTAPNNPNEHPPLWHRLRVVGIRKVELPIKLMVVNTNNVSDKSKWDIQYNLPRTRRGQVRITSNFVVLGDEIQVDENDKRTYRIYDVRHVENVEPKNAAPKAAAAPNADAQKEGNASNVGKFIVKLREVIEPGSKLQPDELEMVTGEPVYSSDLRPIIQDTGRPGVANIVRRLGADIVINRLVGTNTTAGTANRYLKRYSEKYRVLKADPRTQHVTLGKVVGVVEDDSTLETVVITPEGQIPAMDIVTEVQDKTGDAPAENE